jgi:hypothetical protein
MPFASFKKSAKPILSRLRRVLGMELSSETQISVSCFQKEVTSSCSLLQSRATLFASFKKSTNSESASPSVGYGTVF